MLTCKETTELISREADERLTLKESFDMRLHVMMCGACRNFRTNVQFLHQACKTAGTPDRPDERSAPKNT